jgi:hypothetical protein
MYVLYIYLFKINGFTLSKRHSILQAQNYIRLRVAAASVECIVCILGLCLGALS